MLLQLEPFSKSDLAENPQLAEAMQLVLQGKMDAAVANLRDQMQKKLPGSAFFLAALHLDTSRYADVVSVIEASPDLGTHSQAWAMKGVAYFHLNKPRNALFAFRRALLFDWRNHRAHRWAWCALEVLGLLQKSLELARHEIENNHSANPSATQPSAVDLANITLCAIDCVHPALSTRALHISARDRRFGAVKLLTSMKFRAESMEIVAINHLASAKQYSEFVIKKLHQFIDTEFVLLVQWDGYVLNPEMWKPEFLNFDYIGARWPTESPGSSESAKNHDVGNGGFSLRSKRLLTAAASLAEKYRPDRLHPEDVAVCHRMRTQLEVASNIRYAQSQLADQFSFEHALPDGPTFGFHGATNLAFAINDPSFSRLEFLNKLLDVTGQP